MTAKDYRNLEKKSVKLTKIIRNNYLQAKDISILYDLKKQKAKITETKKLYNE